MNTTVCDLKSRTFPTNYSLVLRARRVIARLPPDAYAPLPKLRAHSHQRTQREERKSRVGNWERCVCPCGGLRATVLRRRRAGARPSRRRAWTAARRLARPAAATDGASPGDATLALTGIP